MMMFVFHYLVENHDVGDHVVMLSNACRTGCHILNLA
jgi:hypothetical protein